MENRGVTDQVRQTLDNMSLCLVMPAMEENTKKDSQGEGVLGATIDNLEEKEAKPGQAHEPPCIGCGLCVIGCPLRRKGPPEDLKIEIVRSIRAEIVKEVMKK